MDSIFEATQRYERWMRSCMPIVESALREKHNEMRDDVFSFLRAAYFRWAQLFPVVCPDLSEGPTILAIGDLHVGSFGTWRDSEGRLCWGVDDFDQSHPLPYGNDLVRLAASVRLVADDGSIGLRFRKACDTILEGYECTLRKGPRPIVLAENETDLEKLGFEALKSPPDFWETLLRKPTLSLRELPRDARAALEQTLPARGLGYKVVRRQAGVGSLGQPRYVAIAAWQGGCVAREAKAYLPSMEAYRHGRRHDRICYYEKAIRTASRAPDPYQLVTGKWIIRRLSPDSNPIELADLPDERDDEVLLYAMAQEVANVHLATLEARSRILRDLQRRPKGWLRAAAKQMAKMTKRDWKAYAAG
jgi:Uncharacterized protein conserved in bacteria (DUF2252)